MAIVPPMPRIAEAPYAASLASRIAQRRQDSARRRSYAGAPAAAAPTLAPSALSTGKSVRWQSPKSTSSAVPHSASRALTPVVDLSNRPANLSSKYHPSAIKRPAATAKIKEWTPDVLRAMGMKHEEKAALAEMDAVDATDEDFPSRLGAKLHAHKSDVKEIVAEVFTGAKGGELKLAAWRLQVKRLMPLSFAETAAIDALFHEIDAEGRGRVSPRGVRSCFKALAERAAVIAAHLDKARSDAQRMRQRAEMAKRAAVAIEDATAADARLEECKAKGKLAHDANAMAVADADALSLAKTCALLHKAASMQKEALKKALDQDKAMEAASRREALVELVPVAPSFV